jgi:quercetin dioxygenase-like cupin family protein
MTEPQLFDRAQPHDCREALFGGHGRVRVWALLASPALPFTAVLACELEPHGSVGAHVQQQYPELVICLSGRGHVAVNGVDADFSAGKVVELPHGQTLAIDNGASEEPLRYLIIKSS